MPQTGLDVALTTDIVDDVANAKGVANYVRFLTDNLAGLDTDHEFATVHFKASDADVYRHGFEDVVVDPYPIPGEGIQKLVTNRFRGRRAFADFDVVHVTAPRLYYFPLFAAGDYKTIMTVHAMDLHIPPGMEATLPDEPHAWLQQTLLNRYFELVREHVDAIITVSEFLKAELVEHKDVSPEKVHPVHLAPESQFRVTDATADRPFVLSDTPEPRLIEMFRRLKEAGCEHDLVVFSMRGYGYERAKGLVAEYGLEEDVEFRGYVPDEELVDLYNTASVYVRFADYEGFGLPPVEAMACGCPVVTSDAGSLPEVVADAGITLDAEDVEGYVDAVAHILSDDEYRETMVDAGLDRADSFSWERTARETVAVYEAVAIGSEGVG